MQTKSLSIEALKGTIFLSSLGWLSKAVGVINSFFVIYLFSIYEYGLYSLVLSIINMAEAFLFEEMNQLITTDILIERRRNNEARARKIYQEYFTVNVILGLLTFLVLFVCAQTIANYMGYGSISLFIKIGSFMVLTRIIVNFLIINININKQFFQLGLLGFFEQVIKLVFLVIVFLFFYPGVAKIIFIMVLVNFLATLPLIIKNYKDLSWWFKNFEFSVFTGKKSELWRIVRGHGKWNIFSGLVSKFQKNIKPWLVNIFISTEAVAIYNFGKNLSSHLDSLLPIKKVINQLLPEIIHDQQRLQRVLIYGTKYTSLLYIIVGIVGIIVMPIFVYLLFPKYLWSIPIFLLFLINNFSYGCVGQISLSILYSMRQQKFLSYLPVFKAFSVIILNSWFLPLFGIFGIVFEFHVTMFLQAIFLYLKTISLLKCRFSTIFKIFSYDHYDEMITKNIFIKIINRLKTVFRIKRHEQHL